MSPSGSGSRFASSLNGSGMSSSFPAISSAATLLRKMPAVDPVKTTIDVRGAGGLRLSADAAGPDTDRRSCSCTAAGRPATAGAHPADAAAAGVAGVLGRPARPRRQRLGTRRRLQPRRVRRRRARVRGSCRTPPALVGASLGGIASLAAIAETPKADRRDRLVLVDVAPRIEAARASRASASS